MKFKELKSIIFGELKESKNYILTIGVLFFLSIIFGFFFSEKLEFLNVFLIEAFSKVKDLRGFELIIAIFANNTQTALISLIFGIFFGIFPIISTVFNGVVIGYVFAKVASIAGYSQLLMILPHGIFEIPAIFIALGMGLRLGTSFFFNFSKKSFFSRLYRTGIVFIALIIPLLLLAAIIEGLLITLVK